MRNIIQTFGRRTDGSYMKSQVFERVSSNSKLGLFITSASANPFRVSFKGHTLDVSGWIVTLFNTKQPVFLPEMTIGIPDILKWCNRHKCLTRDLFKKHNLRFISPKTGSSGLKFTFNKHYEEYIILVHGFLNECRFVDEWLNEIMDCD